MLAKSLQDNERSSLCRVRGCDTLSCSENGILTSIKYGYPRSITARTDTSLAGMRVLPFFGYSLPPTCTVVPLLLEDRLVMLEDLELLRWE